MKRKLITFNGCIGMVDTDGRVYVSDVLESDLFREHWPKARKRHRCCECGQHIEPGKKYQLVEGLWDGDCWDRYKTCAGCAELRRGVRRSWKRAVPFGELLTVCEEDVLAALRAGDTDD